MKITPYADVCGVPFGCTKEFVLFALGPPIAQNIDRLKQLELVYPSIVFRFKESYGELVEVTANAEQFEIEGLTPQTSPRKETAFVELGFAFAKLDQNSFFTRGFFVSPKFGLAFDPHCSFHLTAFAQSELPAWHALA